MQLIFTWFISCVRESSVIDPQVDQSYDSSHILNQNNRVNMEFCMTCDVIGQGINQDVKSSDTVCEAGDISMQDCQTLHNYLGNEIWSHDLSRSQNRKCTQKFLCQDVEFPLNGGDSILFLICIPNQS